MNLPSFHGIQLIDKAAWRIHKFEKNFIFVAFVDPKTQDKKSLEWYCFIFYSWDSGNK